MRESSLLLGQISLEGTAIYYVWLPRTATRVKTKNGDVGYVTDLS